MIITGHSSRSWPANHSTTYAGIGVRSSSARSHARCDPDAASAVSSGRLGEIAGRIIRANSRALFRERRPRDGRRRSWRRRRTVAPPRRAACRGTRCRLAHAASSSQVPMRKSPRFRASLGGSSSRHASARSGSGPASTPSSRSRSSALRAMGPNTLMSASVCAAAHVVEVPALRDHAEAGLEPEHAAAVRRDAHRAADVGAELEAGEAGGDRGRRATRRSADGVARATTGCWSRRRAR